MANMKAKDLNYYFPGDLEKRFALNLSYEMKTLNVEFYVKLTFSSVNRVY